MTTHFPEWIRRKWSPGKGFEATERILSDLRLHTVCQSARCPNQSECWQQRTATVMVLGAICTRKCGFCAVNTGTPEPVDAKEPWRVAQAVRRLELRHAVITSVTRDDLPDGGSGHFAETIEAIREVNPDTSVEVLVPDFNGSREHITRVLQARPDVFGHNIEAVERLYLVLRDRRYEYRRGLDVLRVAAEIGGAIVKSALMVGHGETQEEVERTLRDLREAGCEAVAIGQYLRPSPRERAVAGFIAPEQFAAYERLARGLGFSYAAAGPFVRSSYRSEIMFAEIRARVRAPVVEQPGHQ